MINGVRHIGIVVNDIENAIKFWVNLLEFKVVIDQIEEGEFIDKLLGLNTVSVRTVKLAAQDGSLVELLHFISHKSLSAWEGNPYKTGLTHIALNVKDIKEIVLRLEQNSYHKINEIQKSSNGNVLVCYIKGYEGTLLELVEVTQI
jgi:catechol 2,3-dioxygenase-like lactoylglutathione lyase family enzyme